MIHFPFFLPNDRIAHSPKQGRDDSRLLVYDASAKTIEHSSVKHLVDFLKAGDLLIFNEARVDPVLLTWYQGEKKQELLLLKYMEGDAAHSIWEAIVSGKKTGLGVSHVLSSDLSFKMNQSRSEKDHALVEINASQAQVLAFCEKVGRVPLPPYIRKSRQRLGQNEWNDQDAERYQSIFAKRSGAVAAPTASLHFTENLFKNLEAKKIDHAFVFLAVGWGTFGAFTPEQWQQKKLHEEFVSVPASVAQKMIQAKKEGRRVITVGTTSTRSIEWWAIHGMNEGGFEGMCDLFLQVPWKSRVIDGIFTNFHLPDSSLIALVAGFLGSDGESDLLRVYQEALKENYQFYSYGDAMLVLNGME